MACAVPQIFQYLVMSAVLHLILLVVVVSVSAPLNSRVVQMVKRAVQPMRRHAMIPNAFQSSKNVLNLVVLHIVDLVRNVVMVLIVARLKNFAVLMVVAVQ
jgi:hypothetical protein